MTRFRRQFEKLRTALLRLLGAARARKEVRGPGDEGKAPVIPSSHHPITSSPRSRGSCPRCSHPFGAYKCAICAANKGAGLCPTCGQLCVHEQGKAPRAADPQELLIWCDLWPEGRKALELLEPRWRHRELTRKTSAHWAYRSSN